MLRTYLIIALLAIPLSAQAKIVKQINSDGTTTYINVHDAPPVEDSIKKDDPNIGDNVSGAKVLNITTKVVGQSRSYIDVSIRLKIKNNSDDEEVSVRLSALDADDFEREDTYISGRIKPGRVGYISDVAYVDRKAFQHIKKWVVK